MSFLNQEILRYSENFSSEPTKILQELSRETNYKVLMPRMMSSHLMGLMLQFISKMTQPKYILEIGTYTGYSAICLAQGLAKNGQLHTIEINAELESLASKYFKKAKLANKIHLHIGNALTLMPELKLKFDLIFIDADKKNYCKYYELAINQLSPGGFILIDNVLWSGKVLHDSKINDAETKAIKKLNSKVKNDKRVQNILLPLRDGLMLCQLL